MSEGDLDQLDDTPELWGRERGWRARMIWLVPLGLAIDIALSLWVSYRHVTHSVIIQVEDEWVPGERLAARAQMVDHDRDGVDKVDVELALVDAAGRRYALGKLADVEGGGLNQGAFEIPASASVGLGAVHFAFDAQLPSKRRVRIDERVPVSLVKQRTPRTPVHRVASSTLQWADDTQAQPEALRIDAMPYGRLLAGFDNEILVRITDPAGRPMQRDVEVRLVSGEFANKEGPGEGKVGAGAKAPLLYKGRTDAWGLIAFDGLLSSDVIRLEAKVLEDTPTLPSSGPAGKAPSDDPKAKPGSLAPPPSGPDALADEAAPKLPERAFVTRRFRLVSFAGGVRIELDRQSAPAPAVGGDDATQVGIEGRALMDKRPIYVDVHGPDGAWIDTIMPPLRSYESGRKWTLPASLARGFTHFEAYTHTNSPGQSAEVARIWVTRGGQEADRLDAGLIDAQRNRLDLPRDKTGFDVARERAYLAQIEAKRQDIDAESLVGRWLMGSLPVELYGPPVGVSTRKREDDALAKSKAAWKIGLRAFLWGGGGLAIVLTGFSLFREQRRLVVRAQEALADEDAGAQMSAPGMLFARGMVVVVLLVSALALTAIMLESLVWKF